MKEYRLSADMYSELELFSAKMEQLRNLVDLVNEKVWNELATGNENEEINRAGILSEALSEIVRLRDREFSEIVNRILHDSSED